ncbi:hypothetical protein JOF53_001104 [Crossiella equi]|uniref:Secreted protein n=1 Tax=Crossiella equi TaxID=130796 RepID=A0ABS5A7L7_9PSEU|nr:hypothetical protein [Crossiella equi]MBP2472232.1 hypothetical protein [Crossiella equi]
MTTRASTIAASVVLLASGLGLSTATAQQGADDTPPPLEENYEYPGAARIFADRGIRLIKGDGRIEYAKCGTPGEIEVRSTNVPGDKDPDKHHYCFKVTGTSGWLTMNIPNAYQVNGAGRAGSAKVTVRNETKDVPLDRDGWTGVGVGAGPDPAVLLELRVTAS